MNELWKGIAIAGIWIACAVVIILPTFAVAKAKDADLTINGGGVLFLFALIATGIVAYA